jgi:hypothetical protein
VEGDAVVCPGDLPFVLLAFGFLPLAGVVTAPCCDVLPVLVVEVVLVCDAEVLLLEPPQPAANIAASAAIATTCMKRNRI